jgi:hypothetical protein
MVTIYYPATSTDRGCGLRLVRHRRTSREQRVLEPITSTGLGESRGDRQRPSDRRHVATPDIYPRLAYRDQLSAVAYLTRVFGVPRSRCRSSIRFTESGSTKRPIPKRTTGISVSASPTSLLATDARRALSSKQRAELSSKRGRVLGRARRPLGRLLRR